MFLLCGYAVLPTVFSEKIVLSSLFSLVPWSKQSDCLYKEFYLGPLFYSTLASMSIVMQVPDCFDYFSFVVSLEIRKCEISSFVF